MRGDDGQLREVGRQFVDRRRMRVTQFRAHAAGHTGAHAGGADVDHHGRLQFIDRLKKRM